ncbi:hypothetical protein A5731_05055 [Mycolicibacterium conceptionense]|jgi:hypothetical protein|uniref:Uncharacterized protein n=3 Tax=Mycolicibacterium TaxID=1866885 RepID=A0A0J8UI79_9MYCO|nr:MULTISPECIES: hypothetical protein [Mycolicibacterium]KLI07919.1 hypothetical protein AA982_12505 [Mycolicibacterium senegalense]KLO48219.1 hypothetical protein ABW05_26230 [Mycolicibacterium senegalense]KMV20612.1 hypothetical protein ACT17_02910 [Mycolicibacterium conceptionense]MCW1821062.1 hypothetical protein [Mycolicibacterium senegalense]OBB05912.1 hypothetical protein A5718_21710 [Mycolicibacterium conceptionense]
MTDVVLLTIVCLLGTGAAMAAAARRTRRVRPNDEADERLVTLGELVAEFDHMLVRKGLLTGAQLALIRTGTRSRGIVTGMRTTGVGREDYREVELDLMVSRRGGGQFPVRQRALIPATALAKVSPGNVVETYYRPGDESAVAVCVSPA